MGLSGLNGGKVKSSIPGECERAFLASGSCVGSVSRRCLDSSANENGRKE